MDYLPTVNLIYIEAYVIKQFTKNYAMVDIRDVPL